MRNSNKGNHTAVADQTWHHWFSSGVPQNSMWHPWYCDNLPGVPQHWCCYCREKLVVQFSGACQSWTRKSYSRSWGPPWTMQCRLARLLAAATFQFDCDVPPEDSGMRRSFTSQQLHWWCCGTPLASPLPLPSSWSSCSFANLMTLQPLSAPMCCMCSLAPHPCWMGWHTHILSIRSWGGGGPEELREELTPMVTNPQWSEPYVGTPLLHW